MSSGIVTASYITASVLFILALGGLSNQEKAKRAVWFGIAGMALSVFFTVFGGSSGNFWLLFPMIIAGSAIGYYVAKKVEMTAIPEMVSLFNGFGGACAVAISIVEMGKFTANSAVGVVATTYSALFIGAVAFTGSLIAYGKLAGKVKDLSVVDINYPYFGGEFSNEQIKKALDKAGLKVIGLSLIHI